MNIGIDAREIKRPRTGVGTYVLNLVQALAAIDRDNTYLLFVERGTCPPFALPENMRLREVAPAFLDKIQDQWGVMRAIADSRVHLFHATHHDIAPLLVRKPLVVTVMDIAPMDFPNPSRLHRAYYYSLTRLAVQKARRIITISEATRQRVRHYFPAVASKIQAVPISCHADYRPCVPPGVFEQLSAEYGLRRPYILYIGSFAARKNVPLLIEAMRIVWAQYPQVQLVLAGVPSGRDDTPVPNPSAQPPVVVIDRYKTQAELNSLYVQAEMLVFPSRYEGFGLPALEAMRCGCPVIAARTTSLPEIVGEAGLLIDPDDAPGLAAQVSRLLRDQELRRTLSSAGLIQAQQFKWSKVAEQTLNNYRRAVDGREP
jgi:glycosyltransferase involved in cell wall biosynthesis